MSTLSKKWIITGVIVLDVILFFSTNAMSGKIDKINNQTQAYTKLTTRRSAELGLDQNGDVVNKVEYTSSPVNKTLTDVASKAFSPLLTWSSGDEYKQAAKKASAYMPSSFAESYAPATQQNADQVDQQGLSSQVESVTVYRSQVSKTPTTFDVKVIVAYYSQYNTTNHEDLVKSSSPNYATFNATYDSQSNKFIAVSYFGKTSLSW